MKRYGADKDSDVRERMEPEVARHSGPLTDDEIEEIRQAYRDGCQGEVIIGMRGNERVVTMLVPAQSDSALSRTSFLAVKDRLREMECDRINRIRSTCH